MVYRDNDKSIDDVDISKLRFRVHFMVGSLIFTMYGTDTYPRVFYMAIGDDKSLKSPPASTVVLEACHAIMVSLFFLQWLGFHIIRKKEQYVTKNKIPRQLHNLLLAFLLIIGVAFCYEALKGEGYIGNKLVSILFLVLSVGMISPLCMILASKPLRLYALPIIKNSTAFIGLSSMSTMCLLILRKKSASVEPTV